MSRTYTFAVPGLVFVGLMALGCSKSSSADDKTTKSDSLANEPIGGSCNAVSIMSVCMDYPLEADAKKDCPSFGGSVSTSPCPASGLSGSCKIDGKGIRRYYSTGPMPSTADYAKGHCSNSMAGTFSAAPVAAAAGSAASLTSAAAPAAAVVVSPEMTQFMSMLNGSSKNVGAALKKHGAPKLNNQDMDMWNLATPKVTATAQKGSQTCYTMTAASGATSRGYELCWSGGKIVAVTDQGML